jgi:DNA polymerase IV
MLVRNQKSVVHMDLDSFFVSVEVLHNPRLKNRAVLIGGGSDRGVVASCSYEARRFGVHAGMPMKLARRLCPQAIIQRGDSERYSYYSNVVTQIVEEEVPLYEKSSIDEFYIDLTGMDKFFGNYKLASEIRQRITRETGLPISFGLSQNKTVSKVAAGEAKPNGQMQIEFGNEKVFLSPLSIKKIPGVGSKTYYLLRDMGVQKIQTLQQMPVELMNSVLGKHGIVLWKKANGIDNSPVVPYTEAKSISTEQTFEKDTIDVARLRIILMAMTEKLAFKLRKQEKLTACVAVKIRYSDFDTHTVQKRIPYSSADHVLAKVAQELFEKLYQRRLLVRLIGVRFSHLVSGGYQINMFDDTEEMINLYQAMDRMKIRFGSDKIHRAATLGIKHHDFNPFNGKKTGE